MVLIFSGKQTLNTIHQNYSLKLLASNLRVKRNVNLTFPLVVMTNMGRTNRDVAQEDRAAASYAVCRWFDSNHLYQIWVDAGNW